MQYINRKEFGNPSTTNLLKDVENRILKEKKGKVHIIINELDDEEPEDRPINEIPLNNEYNVFEQTAQNIMDIDDEKVVQYNKAECDINLINPKVGDKESDSSGRIINTTNSINKGNNGFENITFGHKRNFQQYTSANKSENAFSTNFLSSNPEYFSQIKNLNQNPSSNNNLRLINNKNSSFSQNYFNNNKPSSINLNENQTPNINNNPQSDTIPPTSSAHSNITGTVKKIIPFQNNYNLSSNSAPEKESSDNKNNLLENQNFGNGNNQNLSNNENNKSFDFQSIFRNANLSSNFITIQEKNSFSKAVINNKVFSEDNNCFIPVTTNNAKRSYREGLFYKDEYSTTNILKNNFGKADVTSSNTITKAINKEKSDEENAQKDRNDTDEDPEEIRIIDENLQRYLDEDKVITDKKLKISVIRKVAPFFKIINQPSNQDYYTEVINKIKIIINEEKSDIILLLNYEYLKCQREKVFQKFCKMINKFFLKLSENKVKEFGGELYYLEIPDTLKERMKNIYTKVNDYFDRNKELE